MVIGVCNLCSSLPVMPLGGVRKEYLTTNHTNQHEQKSEFMAKVRAYTNSCYQF